MKAARDLSPLTRASRANASDPWRCFQRELEDDDACRFAVVCVANSNAEEGGDFILVVCADNMRDDGDEDMAGSDERVSWRVLDEADREEEGDND